MIRLRVEETVQVNMGENLTTSIPIKYYCMYDPMFWEASNTTVYSIPDTIWSEVFAQYVYYFKFDTTNYKKFEIPRVCDAVAFHNKLQSYLK